jgi:glycosyltransferase involved in cell wall biosynthesis
LLATTHENANLIQKYHQRHAKVIPENAIEPFHNNLRQQIDAEKNNKDIINLIWVGRIDTAKAITILLRALKVHPNRKWKLKIVGRGPLEEKSKREAQRFGIASNISWMGHRLRTEAITEMSKADLLIITSLAEGNPTIMWEAMSVGLPVITLDHCGMADNINNNSGKKIPLDTIDRMALSISECILEMQNNPTELAQKKHTVRLEAKKHAWNLRALFWDKQYTEAIENHNAMKRRMKLSKHSIN